MKKLTLWLLPIGLVAGLAIAQQDAKAYLKQVQQKYRNAKTLDVKVNLVMEFQLGSNTGRQSIEAHIVAQFPNKVYAQIKGGMMGTSEIYSDGKTMYLYQPATKQYLKREAPPSLKGPGAGTLGPIGLLFAWADEDLDKGGTNRKFTFKGTQNLDGTQVRIVEITEKNNNSSGVGRFFVGQKDMLIRRVEFTATSKNPQSGQSMVQKVTATIRYNSFNKPVPASRFKFTPPKDAKQMQMPTPQGGPNPGARP